MTCNTLVTMALVPGAPLTIAGRRAVGDDRRRHTRDAGFTGVIELGRRGCGSNRSMALFSAMPVPGTITPEKMPSVCVSATALPSAS